MLLFWRVTSLLAFQIPLVLSVSEIGTEPIRLRQCTYRQTILSIISAKQNKHLSLYKNTFHSNVFHSNQMLHRHHFLMPLHCDLSINYPPKCSYTEGLIQQWRSDVTWSKSF